MPLEIKYVCSNCRKQQAITISGTETENILCPSCGSTMLETRFMSGYLYVLTNPAMPDLVKIGITTRPVEDRVAELNSATGVPDKFVVEAYCESSDPATHERLVHQSLGGVRVSGKEFFRVDVKTAIAEVQKTTGTFAQGREGASGYCWRCTYCNAPLPGLDTFCGRCQRNSSKWSR